MTIWLSSNLKNQYLKKRQSLELIFEEWKTHAETITVSNDTEYGKWQEENPEHMADYYQWEFNKLFEGLDSLVSILQEKLPIDHVKSSLKSKLKIEQDLYIYLNCQYWRLYELIKGAIQGWEEKNYLSGSICARHIYETIVHCFYILKKSEKYLSNNDLEKFFHLIWSFTTGWNDDWIDKDEWRKEMSKASEYPTWGGVAPIYKLPHFHDSLKFYIKENQENSSRIKMIKHLDNLYRLNSQFAHPNALGSVHFYGEKDGKYFIFNTNKISDMCLESIIRNLHELGEFMKFNGNSILNLKSFFSKMHISQEEYQMISKKYEEKEKYT